MAAEDARTREECAEDELALLALAGRLPLHWLKARPLGAVQDREIAHVRFDGDGHGARVCLQVDTFTGLEIRLYDFRGSGVAKEPFATFTRDARNRSVPELKEAALEFLGRLIVKHAAQWRTP